MAYKFVGKSDPITCSKEVKKLLPKKECNYEKCSFDGIYQPSLQDVKLMVRLINLC